MEREPQTLMEAVRYFADADRTLETMVSLRWPNGVHCPTCGRTDVRFIATRKMWECKEKHPRKQFSAKVGTIFEDSPLPLDKWFVAVWSIANCKNGISTVLWRKRHLGSSKVSGRPEQPKRWRPARTPGRMVTWTRLSTVSFGTFMANGPS